MDPTQRLGSTPTVFQHTHAAASLNSPLAATQSVPDFPDFYDDNAVITSTDVTHLESMVGRLCPLVSQYTGFEFQRKPVLKVFATQEAFRDAVWSDAKHRCAAASEKAVQKSSDSLLSAFLPDSDSLAVSPSLINRTQGEVKAALFHDLVHALDFQNYPNYWAEMRVLSTCANADKAKEDGYIRRVQARMTWVEGHAVVAAKRFKHDAAQRARNTTPAAAASWKALFKLSYQDVSCLARVCTDKRFRATGFDFVHGENLADTVAVMERKLNQPGELARELFEAPSRIDWVMDTMGMKAYSFITRQPDGTLPAKYSAYAYILQAREAALQNALSYKKFVVMNLEDILEQP